jgi:CRISPR-associated protein Cmr2
MFSDITRRLCLALNGDKGKFKNNEYFQDFKLLSPYFYFPESEENNSNKGNSSHKNNELSDGVGKYHDRVIFSLEEKDSTIKEEGINYKEKLKNILNEIIEKVKADTADKLGSEKASDNTREFFKKYLMISYIILDDIEVNDLINTTDSTNKKTWLLVIQEYLDELEVMNFPAAWDGENPISTLFSGSAKNIALGEGKKKSDDDRNALIKNSELFTSLSEEGKKNLMKSNRIKSIEDIARVSKESKYKYTNYYAVVSADGDSMGDFLKTLEDDEVAIFSNACLEYDKFAAKRIVKFGGMPIYAGGDDLLFLAPVKDIRDNSIVKLCNEISELFKNTITNGFKENSRIDKEKIPTVSFGISVQYYKYPLYEALERARNELSNAKEYEFSSREEKKKKKNCISITLEKHSGQSTSLIFGSECSLRMEKILSGNFDKDETTEGKDDKLESLGDNANNILKSLCYTLELQKTVIAQIEEKFPKRNIDVQNDSEPYPWDNIFDNEGQDKAREYLKAIQRWYYNEFVYGSDWRLEFPKSKKCEIKSTPQIEHIDTLVEVLRMSKFLIEGKGGNDD